LRNIVTGLMRSGTGFNYAHDREFRRKRTERCEHYLTRLGRRLGFLVMPSKVSRVEQRLPEYLVDLCWLDPERWGMELALEMEWNRHAHDVQYDFRKLVLIKAPRKIMLCAPYPAERSEALQRMLGVAQSAKRRDKAEQYAIVFFVYSKDDRELTRKNIESRAFLLDSTGRFSWQLVATKERNAIIVRSFHIRKGIVKTRHPGLLVDSNYRSIVRTAS